MRITPIGTETVVLGSTAGGGLQKTASTAELPRLE